MTLYKAEEWQGADGKWHIGCISDLGKNSNCWYYPARILDISPCDFITLLIEEYDAECHWLGNILIYKWESQTKARKWKNFINKRAREVKFYI